MEYLLDLRMLRPDVYEYIVESHTLDDWVQDSYAVYQCNFDSNEDANAWNTSLSDNLHKRFSDEPFYLFYTKS